MAVAAVAAGAGIVGAATQVYGMVKANQAQAEVDRQNQAFYKEQAAFAQKAGDRELSNYKDQSEQVAGNQVSGFAAGGVELSGSPLLVMADTRRRQSLEEDAIRTNTAQNVLEASQKGTYAGEEADRAGSFASNGLPAIGTGLTAISGAIANYQKAGG